MELWYNGITASLFKYLVTPSKMKILESSTVSKVYIVATILRNCHVALYGSQSSNYFNLTLHEHMLEKYIISHQADF